jgi:transglutaminase/protease-like cytokinesis protein 3
MPLRSSDVYLCIADAQCICSHCAQNESAISSLHNIVAIFYVE